MTRNKKTLFNMDQQTGTCASYTSTTTTTTSAGNSRVVSDTCDSDGAIHPSIAFSFGGCPPVGGLRSLSDSCVSSDVSTAIVNIDALQKVLQIIIKQVNALSNNLSGMKDNVTRSFHNITTRDTHFEAKITDLIANCSTVNEVQSWCNSYNAKLVTMEKKMEISSSMLQTENHDLNAKLVNLEQKMDNSTNLLRAENQELKTQWAEQIERMKSHLDLLEQQSSHADSHSTELDVNSENDNSQRIYSNRDSQHSDDVFNKSTSADIEELFDMLYDLDCRVIECEQYPRRDNLIISGIPACVKQNELESTVLNIIRELGFNIGPADVSACHRLGRGRNGHPARVIVRFVNRKVVDFCLTNKRRLAELRRVLRMNLRFYESLCSRNEETLKLCYELKDNGDIHDFFIRNGFLKVIETEGDNPVRINHPQELRNMFPEGS